MNKLWTDRRKIRGVLMQSWLEFSKRYIQFSRTIKVLACRLAMIILKFSDSLFSLRPMEHQWSLESLNRCIGWSVRRCVTTPLESLRLELSFEFRRSAVCRLSMSWDWKVFRKRKHYKLDSLTIHELFQWLYMYHYFLFVRNIITFSVRFPQDDGKFYSNSTSHDRPLCG